MTVLERGLRKHCSPIDDSPYYERKEMLIENENKSITHVKCELCDFITESNDDKGLDTNWSDHLNTSYTTVKTKVEIVEGFTYPITELTKTSFDICGECFNTKLIPWLKLQNAKPQISELS